MKLADSLRGHYNRLNFYEMLPREQKKMPLYPLDGLNGQQARLMVNGGISQQDRMIFDKRRSLDRALRYSYQSAVIRKIFCDDSYNNTTYFNVSELDEHKVCRALINPDKLKMDYDDKILSVHYEEDFHPGDIFEWVGTDSYWICYLQDMDEKAYFRSEIRRCQYEIKWEDEEGELHSTYAAVRGPVETKINYIQKHQISVDIPNHSLSIYMPRNKSTMEYFRRYSKFYLTGTEEGSPQVCWRVEATDWISTPGILEVIAVEYYANEIEDDIENGIAGAMIAEPINPNTNETENYISGETFIKPKEVYEYYYTGLDTDSWSLVDDTVPVRFKIDPNNPLHIKLIWETTYSGSFIIKYGSYEKTIVVESLF